MYGAVHKCTIKRMASAERRSPFVVRRRRSPRFALMLPGRTGARRTAHIPLTRSRLPSRLLHLDGATKARGKRKGGTRAGGAEQRSVLGRMQLVARFASHFELYSSSPRLLLLFSFSLLVWESLPSTLSPLPLLLLLLSLSLSVHLRRVPDFPSLLPLRQSACRIKFVGG